MDVMDSDTSRSPETEAHSNETDRDVAKPPVAKPPSLRREVLYPQRQSTGVGVMLVASAAMFFAVASSAFILRAQMPMSDQCPGASSGMGSSSVQQSNFEAVEVELIDVRAVDSAMLKGMPCDEPIYQDNPDGPSSIIFRLCD